MAFLRGWYDQIVGPRRYLPKFADRLCRHPDVWVCLYPHATWQAAESYVKGGNAFWLVLLVGFLTRQYGIWICYLLFPRSMALAVAVVAVVV